MSSRQAPSTRLSRRTRALPRLQVVVAVAALAAAPVAASPTEGEPAVIGEAHPALEVETLDGDVVNARRVAGHPLVVDFFATWCGPCHQALADLVATHHAAPADTLWILVDLQETPAEVRAWAAAAALPPGALVSLDLHGAAYRRWGARKLPTTFLVDARGVVRHINRGWGPGYRARMARWLKDLGAVAVPPPGSPPGALAPATAPARPPAAAAKDGPSVHRP